MSTCYVSPTRKSHQTVKWDNVWVCEMYLTCKKAFDMLLKVMKGQAPRMVIESENEDREQL